MIAPENAKKGDRSPQALTHQPTANPATACTSDQMHLAIGYLNRYRDRKAPRPLADAADLDLIADNRSPALGKATGQSIEPDLSHPAGEANRRLAPEAIHRAGLRRQRSHERIRNRAHTSHRTKQQGGPAEGGKGERSERVNGPCGPKLDWEPLRADKLIYPPTDWQGHRPEGDWQGHRSKGDRCQSFAVLSLQWCTDCPEKALLGKTKRVRAAYEESAQKKGDQVP
jgi:hypothetical protein